MKKFTKELMTTEEKIKVLLEVKKILYEHKALQNLYAPGLCVMFTNTYSKCNDFYNIKFYIPLFIKENAIKYANSINRGVFWWNWDGNYDYDKL